MTRRQAAVSAQFITAATHLTFGWVLVALARGGLAAVGVACAWAFSAWRVHRAAWDPLRPWWVVRLVDEPMFCHWGASLFGTALLPVAAVVAWATRAPFALVALGAYGLGFALSAWGIWVERRRLRVTEIEVAIAGLPRAFEGYRIVQLSDLHIGGFTSKKRALGWAARANATGADLAIVTGDLVSTGTEYYPDAAEVVGALRAPHGTIVILGNHDQWDPGALRKALEARAAKVLINEHTQVERDGAKLVIAGLGDWYSGDDDFDRTLGDRATTILLAHYPHSFERAAERGVPLVLSGHTHGGQIGVPLVGDYLNIATLTRQRARGVFRCGESTMVVSAGLGTTGPPMRIGVIPEIVVIVLRPRASS